MKLSNKYSGLPLILLYNGQEDKLFNKIKKLLTFIFQPSLDQNTP